MPLLSGHCQERLNHSDEWLQLPTHPEQHLHTETTGMLKQYATFSRRRTQDTQQFYSPKKSRRDSPNSAQVFLHLHWVGQALPTEVLANNIYALKI